MDTNGYVKLSNFRTHSGGEWGEFVKNADGDMVEIIFLAAAWASKMELELHKENIGLRDIAAMSYDELVVEFTGEFFDINTYCATLHILVNYWVQGSDLESWALNCSERCRKCKATIVPCSDLIIVNYVLPC